MGCFHNPIVRQFATTSLGMVYHSVSKGYSGYLEKSYYAPGVFHRGLIFLQQSCISVEFRYNTNKDYFFILYFI